MFEREETVTSTDFDVIIVGAGIAGIAAGCHVKRNLPGKTFAILEGRDATGGTWDLFRYPGIRSDSDMHTFGYEFKPWKSKNSIADGEEIVAYLREAIAEHELDRNIRLGHRVVGADWSSDAARWTVRVQRGDEALELTCRFLFSGTGYYDYTSGFAPHFEGRDEFAGQIVHPQAWPEDLDYTDKRVVVIGSGATAVTLVPAMTDRAGHVTMLQRSPSYIMSVPARNPLANGLQRVLPDRLAHRITRRINVAVWQGMYVVCQRHPKLVRRVIHALTKLQLPKGYPVDMHFRPQYNPWDERLCASRNGDLFKAIKAGTASVVTDRIARCTKRGILLESGAELEADIVVTATGLNMLAFGGLEMTVDRDPVIFSDTVVYKSMMLSGVPNFAFALGYTNISWTLKVDLVCEHLCRLLAYMDETGHDAAVPVVDDPALERLPLFDMQAGYIERAVAAFPSRGSHGPWTVQMNYAVDRVQLLEGPIEDPALQFRSSLRELTLAA